MEMNAVIKSIKSLMPSESSFDTGSMSYFARRIVISDLISNKPQEIKRVGNYEYNNEMSSFVTA